MWTLWSLFNPSPVSEIYDVRNCVLVPIQKRQTFQKSSIYNLLKNCISTLFDVYSRNNVANTPQIACILHSRLFLIDLLASHVIARLYSAMLCCAVLSYVLILFGLHFVISLNTCYVWKVLNIALVINHFADKL